MSQRPAGRFEGCDLPPPSAMNIRTTLYVGALVQRRSKVLLVRQASGHDLQGQWTIPWGRCGAGRVAHVGCSSGDLGGGWSSYIE